MRLFVVVDERARRFLREADTRAIELLLHLAYVAGISISRNCAGILIQRLLPLRGGQLEAVGLFVQLAEMVMYRGICAVARYSLCQVFFGKGVLPELVVGPAQRVEIRVVL